MSPAFDLPILPFSSAKAWRAWLAKHHDRDTGIWLRFAKKGSGIPSVSYAEALDEALSYGWIDGQKRTYDAKTYALRFTPRRPRSVWSEVNKAHVARLIKEKRMQPAGLRAVEAAKADGRWAAAYVSQKTAEVPSDFLRALAKNKKASTFYATLPKSERYAVYWRLHTAKTPTTRKKRFQELLARFARGERIHPMGKPKIK